MAGNPRAKSGIGGDSRRWIAITVAVAAAVDMAAVDSQPCCDRSIDQPMIDE